MRFTGKLEKYMNLVEYFFPKINLKNDFPASIAVFLVAIPLCLGIAHASGAPLVSGIIAGIIGGIVIGFLSGSQLSVSGPAAGLTAIVLAGIHELKSYEAFLLALIVAGILQILFGILKAGIISNYIPTSVIKGLLAAIGIILILKQIPHVLGYDVEQFGVQEYSLTEEDMQDGIQKGLSTFTLILYAIKNIDIGVLLIGVSSIGFLYLWEKKYSRKYPFIPGSLLIVIMGIGFNELYRLLDSGMVLSGNHLVRLPVITDVESLLYTVRSPDFSRIGDPDVYRVGLVVSLVASLETLLSIEAIDKLDPKRSVSPVNRELVAQGIGNTMNGFFGGLPVTSVIVRSSVNLNSGGKTKYSAILHGVFLLVSFLFIPDLLNKIPIATLAAILCYTGYKLATPTILWEIYRAGWSQFVPCTVTTIAIVFSDLLTGTIIGSSTALIFILKDVYNSPVLKVRRDEIKSKVKVFLGENLTFLHKAKVSEVLKEVPEDFELIIDGKDSLYIDMDILEMFKDYRKHAEDSNIQLKFLNFKYLEKENPEKTPDNTSYEELLENNRDWAWQKTQDDREFFKKLSIGQEPNFLVISCSDSRVPIGTITKAEPGEMFVHRNIANQVNKNDTNMMSIIQFGIQVLKIKQIIVCGHYGCGGIRASISSTSLTGDLDKWVDPIRKLHEKHSHEFNMIEDQREKEDLLVEYNVLEQAHNILNLDFVKKSIQETGFPCVYAWVYDLHTGLIKELGKG